MQIYLHCSAQRTPSGGRTRLLNYFSSQMLIPGLSFHYRSWVLELQCRQAKGQYLTYNNARRWELGDGPELLYESNLRK